MAEANKGGSIEIAEPSDAERARAKLRDRWELASVLNFLRVFRPVISGGLQFTGEQVEEGLMCHDDALAKIHVALLKGIPPVSKNVEAPGAWVTLVCKQMDMWWSWVAEGDAPIATNRGMEVSMYKNLDPVSRLLMLKALCEIRAVQDDIIAYIDETMKNGSPLSTFRTEKIGTDSDGNKYWWDGDNIMGYRLYRERVAANQKQKQKGKGRLVEPTVAFRWETVACDLEQFQDISVQLLESNNFGDVKIANVLRTEIIPLIEKLRKKKERALQRQQREVLQLMGFRGISMGSRRSCRDRKPARYTFDEFDQSIDEALQIGRKRKAVEIHSEIENGALTNLQDVEEDEKSVASGSEEDEDYTEKSIHNDISLSEDSDFESDGDRKNPVMKQKQPAKIIDTTGLRRSTRNMTYPDQPPHVVNNGHAGMKKRLRQRPTPNTEYTLHTVSDSEEISDEETSVQGKHDDAHLHTVTGVTPAVATVR